MTTISLSVQVMWLWETEVVQPACCHQWLIMAQRKKGAGLTTLSLFFSPPHARQVPGLTDIDSLLIHSCIRHTTDLLMLDAVVQCVCMCVCCSLLCKLPLVFPEEPVCTWSHSAISHQTVQRLGRSYLVSFLGFVLQQEIYAITTSQPQTHLKLSPKNYGTT